MVPIGPDAGFKDYVKLRAGQGFNCIAMIAAFPNWKKDDLPRDIWLDQSRRLGLRNAWDEDDADNLGVASRQRQAQTMHNEGGMSFHFPGKVPGYEDYFPDVDRINPEYFRFRDRKIDYLNAHGFIPFIEVSRRDVTPAWKEYYDWPDSYTRYIQYIWSRYQANNCLYSPIHYDSGTNGMTLTAKDFNEAANRVVAEYGPPPFGTLVSANSQPSTLINFGKNNWLTYHQSGNTGDRAHGTYWYLTEIFHAVPTKPAINGEPMYAGLNEHWNKEPKTAHGSEEDDRFSRSSLYGNFLSGGLGGYIYGAQGIWAADMGPVADPTMWEGFTFKSGAEVQHLKTFAFGRGRRYQDLVPNPALALPHRTHNANTYLGWAYCARTDERDYFLAYFEKECPRSIIRGAIPGVAYKARWFNPREGMWTSVGEGMIVADRYGQLQLPELPTDDDWGIELVRE